MAVTKSTNGELSGRQAASALEQRRLLGSIGLIAVVAMLVASAWLRPETVAIASGIICAAGFALAIDAWRRGVERDVPQPTQWDIAGLCAFAGFAGLIGANTALF